MPEGEENGCGLEVESRVLDWQKAAFAAWLPWPLEDKEFEVFLWGFRPTPSQGRDGWGTQAFVMGWRMTGNGNNKSKNKCGGSSLRSE
jgi:hypothetical protein